MGEVYRARDTKLDRDVAIKVLPDVLAADADPIARFTREAKALAALNHPNIAQLYGLEEADGIRALVMELIEGFTIADRIAQGPIPIDEALPIARQIAEALEAAHEQSIIHRDLKPANIKVRLDGTVKVLDFGLAKALEPAALNHGANMPPSLTASPTITSPALMTGVGVILGTAAYMSPEQAKGHRIDKRSDVWAFGCVLFEMLTGKRVFPGDDVTETIAAVVRAQPDWSQLPSETPLAIRRVLRRSLEKDRRQRLSDIGVARIEIDEALSGVHPDAVTTPSRSRPTRERLAWATVAILAASTTLATGVAARLAFRPAPSVREMRVEVQTPPTTAPRDFALSPDGLNLAFIATDRGEPTLWVRSLEDGSARAFARSEGAQTPFWSPDSRSIGFVDGAGSGIKRVDLSDGVIRTLAATGPRVGNGGTWNREGVILVGFGTVQPIRRFSAVLMKDEGPETRVSGQELGHAAPQFLPDGRHFLYFVRGVPEVSGVYIGALGGAAPRRLVAADGSAVVANGHILFSREGSVFAQTFDSTQLAVTGEPFRVAQTEGVSTDTSVTLSASATGVIAYRVSTPARESELIWFDRTGKELGRIPDAGRFNNVDVSNDDAHVLMRRTVDGNNGIWSFDANRSILSFVATGPAASQPLWSADGRRLVYVVSREGKSVILRKEARIDAVEETVFTSARPLRLTSWSADGRYLLYSADSIDTSRSGQDIWALPLQGDRTPVPFVRTRFDETGAQFSNDGRWVGYESNQSGHYEVYVQPWPGPGEPVQISTAGGAQIRWRRDGKEIFYVALDGRLMTVPVTVSASGKSLEPGRPTALFATDVTGGAVQTVGGSRQQYAVSSDGQRFLVSTLRGGSVTAAPITIILNWKPRL